MKCANKGPDPISVDSVPMNLLAELRAKALYLVHHSREQIAFRFDDGRYRHRHRHRAAQWARPIDGLNNLS